MGQTRPFLPNCRLRPFQMCSFHCRFWRPSSIFFASFSLLKVSFWMAISLKFWNPHSEHIWSVKPDDFYEIDVYERFEGLHFHCRLWRPTSIFVATFYLLKVSFWLAINLRIWNPHSERIWWFKQDHFYQIVVYDHFEGLHFLCRLWRPTSIFFANFYLLKVSFWMAGNLRYWNPHSKRIWWVKEDHFYQIVVYDRFEGLHFLCRFWSPTSIFFGTFYLLKVSFWMAINLRYWNPYSYVYDASNKTIFTKLPFTTVSKVYTSTVDSDAHPVFFSRLSTF